MAPSVYIDPDQLKHKQRSNEKVAEYDWLAAKAGTNLPNRVDEFAVPLVPDDQWSDRIDIDLSLSSCFLGNDISTVSLIGEGGIGKSSTVRHWAEEIWRCKDFLSLEGMFWWPFYEKPKVDDFFASALRFFTGTIDDIEDRAAALASIFSKGNYLLILDGLEVVQNANFDDYGRLHSQELFNFLDHIDLLPNRSNRLCVITSRFPLIDLVAFKNHRKLDICRILEEGVDLLKKLGIKGDELSLESLVSKWKCHTLSLCLLGKYLRKYHDGDCRFADAVIPPSDDSSPYEGCWAILAYLDTVISETDQDCIRELITYFKPVSRHSLLSSAHVHSESLDLLVDLGIANLNKGTGILTMHPLIRNYYIHKRNRALIEVLDSWD